MDEYITRSFALDVVKRTSGDYAAAFSEIAHATAADVVPVVHGKWEEAEEFCGDIHYMCSACRIEWYFIEGTPKENGTHYCPDCGAKMDG